jgi:hypothetical protein
MRHRQETAARQGCQAAFMAARSKFQDDIDHRQAGADENDRILIADATQDIGSPWIRDVAAKVPRHCSRLDRQLGRQIADAQRNAIHVEPSAVRRSQLDRLFASPKAAYFGADFDHGRARTGLETRCFKSGAQIAP